MACLCFAGSWKCPLLVFFCAPLFTLRPIIYLRTQEMDGLLAKTNRTSIQTPYPLKTSSMEIEAEKMAKAPLLSPRTVFENDEMWEFS